MIPQYALDELAFPSYGQAKAVHTARQDVLAQAYQANPKRFVRKAPVPAPMPTQTWINPAQKTSINQA
jgi:putative transposase